MNWKLTNNLQLSNFGLGICGELGEVTVILKSMSEDVEKICDEVGDVFWYVANLCTFMDKDWRTLFPGRNKRLKLGDAALSAHQFASNVADIIKKTTAQEHPLNEPAVVEALEGVIAHLSSILVYYGLTPQEVCAYNHQKLLKRYPNGFEGERSTKREI